MVECLKGWEMGLFLFESRRMEKSLFLTVKAMKLVSHQFWINELFFPPTLRFKHVLYIFQFIIHIIISFHYAQADVIYYELIFILIDICTIGYYNTWNITHYHIMYNLRVCEYLRKFLSQITLNYCELSAKIVSNQYNIERLI